MEDILSMIRKHCDFEQLYYGFDYIEIKLKERDIDIREQLQKEIFKELTDDKKFGDCIKELYTEETGWFKIYLDWGPSADESKMITTIDEFKQYVQIT